MLLADRQVLGRPSMLGDLPPLTNGLHEPEEPAVTRSERTQLGDANVSQYDVTWLEVMLSDLTLHDMGRGAPKERARGARAPLGPKKHYIFSVSSVKLRDLHI